MGSSYGSGRVVSCQTSVERCWAKTSGLSRRVLGRPLGQLTDWVWCWYLVRSRLIVLHWSAEELDCSMVSLSWIQRFLSFRADFRILLRRVFNVCGGVSGVTCERRSRVCSVIYGFLVLRFLLWKAGIHCSGKRMNQLKSLLVRGNVLGRSIRQRRGRGRGERRISA